MSKETCRSRSGLEQLEAVFDNLFDAVFILNASKGQIVYANRAMCTMFGYPPPRDALQLTIQGLSAGDSCESFAAAMDKLSKADRDPGRLFNWKARKKDGTFFWTETSLQKADVAGKNLVIALVRDITDRKCMEDESACVRDELEKRVEERTAELAETVQALLLTRFCIETAAIGIYHTTFEGNILSANDFACRSLGYTAEELCALKVPDIDPVITHEKVLEIKTMLDTTGSVTHETVHRRKDGTTFPVEITTNSLEFQGKSYGFSFVKDITERKQAITDLQLTQFFVDKASIGIQRISEEGKIIFANEASCRSLGYTAEELCSMTVFEIDPTFNFDKFREHRRNARAAGSKTIESIHRRKDGTTFPVEITINYLDYQDKEFSVSFVKDITERKRAEEALRESEARLKMAMDLAKLVQWEYDVKSGMFTFDDQFYALYGTTAEREGGNLMSAEDYARRFIPPGESAVVAEGIAEVQEKSCNQLEHRIIRTDGEERFIVVRGEVVRDEAGCIVKTHGANQDITERKRMEEALRQANKVVENSPVVLFRWKGEDEWPVELVSENIIQFGYTPDEFLSGSITYSAILHPDDLERVTREVHDFCTEGADQFRLEYRIIAKGGGIRWLNEHTHVEWDAMGGVKNFEGIVIDVTERKAAEEELKRQKQLLQELNETLEIRVDEEVRNNREKDIMLIQQNRQAALGEMLDHIAHQWKQPLNSISLIIQDLGETASDGELTDAHVTDTVGKTMALLEHMAQTIDIFRQFYRLDKEKKVFRIKDSIDQALTFISPAFRFHSIAVELDVDPGLTAFGYAKEYAQVLLNILANARDAFKARATEKPRVIIRAFAKDSLTVVTITDNAGGIPAAIIGKIFDFYFTTNESTGGTGIGLYMSKNIIEKNMAGKLTAENTDGGAQFRIKIPAT
jgi:PAS domain S-box-containing protein